MTFYSTTQPGLDGDAFAIETIQLGDDAINQAIHLAQPIANEQRQWQTYLNALALFGFEAWLAERSSDLTVNRDRTSLFDPATANLIEAVCHLNVNGFNLCLIAQGSLIDDQVSLPRTVVDIPEFIPHFYVVVDVQEEEETAVVRGFLSYPQLIEQRDTLGLAVEDDWTYSFPLNAFDCDPNHLLLELRCLNPRAIPLPPIPNDRRLQLAHKRSQLETKLPQFQSPAFQLWQILTWEQATLVLTRSELRTWLYQLQTDPQSQSILQNYLSDLLSRLTRNVINVGRWLQDELDELAQELSWQLLPSLTPASAMRSPTAELDAIVQQLEYNNLQIPPQAKGAYHNLQVADTPLRLYAITWPLLSGTVPEWALLLILGTQSPTGFPEGLTLRISDQTAILVEQELDGSSSYFFTSVVGTREETFRVTIRLGSDIEHTLPAFGFNL
ncbi:DUF1822 family protein [Coleofasciculus sp. G2-EDA-02]|uniref:DUF1822 family protein n=1 Tax=Coleofasciculus sp. G2-EDA-02 TaxID=3069529 RepID=UPI0032F2E60B